MHSHLFPYMQRQCWLSHYKVPHDRQCDFKDIAIITVSNLREGDAFSILDANYRVLLNGTDILQYEREVGGTIEQFEIAPTDVLDCDLVAELAAHIPSLAPQYTDELCILIERDPAVFRLKNRMGWVINDALCLLSGNVVYSLGSQTQSASTTMTQAGTDHIPVDTMSSTTVKRTKKQTETAPQMDLF